jgi:integrase
LLGHNDWWMLGRKQVTRDIRHLLWCYAYVAVDTGIRPGTEMEHLTWGDIHTRKDSNREYTTITVRKGKTTMYTGTREVIFKSKASSALASLKNSNRRTEKDDLIFTLPDGNKTTELNRNFMKLIDELNLNDSNYGKRSLYSLRHTYITNQILDRVPLDILAKQVGTSIAMIEQHYSHVMPVMFMEQLADEIIEGEL